MFGINKKAKTKSAAVVSSSTSNGDTTDKKVNTSVKKVIPDLILKSFVDGCLVLGSIHDVSKNELTISLPGIGNYGHVKLNNVSSVYSEMINNEDQELKTLNEMYKKGELVRCKVLNFVDNRLHLTIAPNEVNGSLRFDNLQEDMIISGAVKTREDHGYTIDLGFGDLNGFFKTDPAIIEMHIGQTLLFKVTSKTSKRAIGLSLCDNQVFYSLKTRNLFDTYLPGAKLTNCTIDKVTKNGLHVSLPNQLYAYVHINHIPSNKRKLAESYTAGDTTSGTIIFVNPYSKVIYLSLLPHMQDAAKSSRLAQLFMSDEGLQLGQIIEDAQVSLLTFKGIYVRFQSGKHLVTGFVSKRHLGQGNQEDEEDEEETENGMKLKKGKKDAKNMNQEDIEKLYPINSTIRCRIFDFNLIEDMILLSCRESVLNSPYMSYNELKVGQTVKCKVKSINSTNGGISVELSEFVHGFIPKIHTGDIPLNDESLLAKKFKIGSEMKLKILNLNAEEKRCILTAKKTLIKSKLPLIESFDSIKSGLETYGIVLAIKEYGLLVGFFNELKGILPRQEISKSIAPTQDLSELYYQGQLIRCRVKHYNLEKQTIKLTMLSDDKKQPEEKNNGVELDYEPGEIIESATILHVNEESKYFRLKLPSSGQKYGIIYKNQLSDFAFLNDLLFDYYKQKTSINNLMIINASQKSQDINKTKSACYYLTLKRSLIDFYAHHALMPKQLSELELKKWYHGWICSVMSNGVLVEIPANQVGFCSNLKIENIELLKPLINLGQSVLVRVNKVFDGSKKERFLTSIKIGHYELTQANKSDLEFLTESFDSFISDIENLSDYLTLKRGVEIGSTVPVVIKSFNKQSGQVECIIVKDSSAEVDLNSDLIGHAFVDIAESHSIRPGLRLDALVLAYDPQVNVYCLSVNKKANKIYKRNFDSEFASKQVICQQDQVVKGEILYSSNWFCIVGLKAHALGRLAFMPLFKNDFTQLNRFMAIKDSPVSQLDLNFKKHQLLKVSAASLSEEPISKQDKHFNYFHFGQVLNVQVTRTSGKYLLVLNDLNSVKRNKKLLLRQLAILNEDHAESNGKRKHSIDDSDVVLVKKKLLTESDAKRKRKLTDDQTVDDQDHIEIVTNVKRPRSESISELNESNQAKSAVDAFPWEVTDFDQFYEVLNRVNDQNQPSAEETKLGVAKKDKTKNKQVKLDDKTIFEKEEEVFDPNREPENPDDYERLLASKPNNSLLWIKYMVFYLQMAEVDKARSVATKALQTILFNQDSERLNVWVSLLNLENMYGSAESVEQTLAKAAQNCDSLKIHFHMAEIYARSGKQTEAEALFVKMIKKFSRSPDVWIKYGIFHYRNNQSELARKLLIKSFNSLDKKDHIEMVNKFAQLEFKYGEVERAKSMYDSLLFTYPNRTDIWSVYIDMLVKHEKYDDARHIFDRIIQMGLTVKRMKFIFKKYMDFEKLHGDEASVQRVKELAASYVEKKTEFGEATNGKSHRHVSSMEENLKKKLT